MSVGFGFSFGDFVEAISLVITLYDALKDSTGASADIRMLNAELSVLKTALEAVQDCKLEESDSQYDTAIQAVGDCQKCISEFIEKTLDKYLPITERHKPLKDSLKKVKWVLCKKEDVEKLRAKLARHVQAITLLISAIQLSNARLAGASTSKQLDEQNRILDAVNQKLDRSDTDFTQLLQRIGSLAARPAEPGAEPAPPNYEVRPMRLTGAPRIPQDQVINRSKMLSLLEKALLHYSDETQHSVVLQGFGGVGKSQLALNYAIIHQRTYTAVFWLNAKTETTLRLSIAQLAEQIPLANVLDATRQIRKTEPDIEAAYVAVTNWLCHEGNIGWLLVIDNVDNQISNTADQDPGETDTGLVSTSTKVFDASRYIPHVSHGSILLTSRLSFVGNAFGATTIEVNEMSEDEGIELLCKVSGRATHEDGIETLVHRLGAHPLALSQAGRFLAKTYTTPSDYIQKYDTRIKALFKDPPSLDPYHNGSIAATLGLSYDQLRSRNPTAAALLMLFSCLDNSHISYELFEALPIAKAALVFASDDMPFDPHYDTISELPRDWLNKLCDDETIYLECIASLHEFSFVRPNHRSNGVSLHPLIHEWLLHFCDQTSMSNNLCAVCNLLGAAVPQGKPYVKGLPYSKIEPHVNRWYSLLPHKPNLSKTSVGALLAISEYYVVQGPQERVSLLRYIAYDDAYNRFGHDHRCMAEAGIAIAMVHFEAEEYNEAMHWFKDHREGYIKIRWCDKDIDREETVVFEDLLVTTYLMCCYRATNKLEEAEQASKELAALKAKLEGTALYPVAAWFFFITQDNIDVDEEEGGTAQARIERSFQTSEKLLHDIQNASSWLPVYGSRESAEANLLSVLGQQHLDYGDKLKGQAYLQRALKLKGRLWGIASPITLTHAKEFIKSGAVPTTPLTMRNNAWRSSILKALKSVSGHNGVEHSIRERLRTARKPTHSAWDREQWIEAVITVREATRAVSAD